MNNNQILSIVYITANRCEELIRSIKSCQNHTSREFELVVVDNNSSDGTQIKVERYCKDNNIALNYTYLNENTGVSHARNIGFQKATGDILFFIDDDAVVISDNNSLDLVCDYMRQNENVYSATGVSIDYRFDGVWRAMKAKGENASDYYQIKSFVGFNHFIKKAFTQNPYIYPDNLFYGSEELYMGLTVIKEGGKTIFISDHIVKHNPSRNTRINPYEGRKNGHINTYVIKKYFLPFPYSALSTILFFFRMIRFTKFSFHKTCECIRMAHDRYDSSYDNKMTITQINKVTKKFNFLKIV